ncbi:MAG: hypothetical protein K2Y23_22955 [Cyanobacteria bacterium]|nr:hypothetical protein [Cyanobacteriota bacterium]
MTIGACAVVAGGCRYLSPLDPEGDGRAAAEPYCACATASTRNQIDAYDRFQREFDSRKFTKRRAAQDELVEMLKAPEAEAERCLANANAAHERLRRQFIDDRAASDRFETIVSAARSQCPGSRAIELSERRAASEKRLMSIADDSVNASALLSAHGHGGYRLTTDADRNWDKYEFDTFVTPGRAASPQYPFAVRGDFDGDGREDFALDVVETASRSARLALVWGHGGVMFLDNELCSAMSLVEPKELKSHWEARPLKLSTHAIEINCYEKSSYLLYWDGNGFRRYQLTD